MTLQIEYWCEAILRTRKKIFYQNWTNWNVKTKWKFTSAFSTLWCPITNSNAVRYTSCCFPVSFLRHPWIWVFPEHQATVSENRILLHFYVGSFSSADAFATVIVILIIKNSAFKKQLWKEGGRKAYHFYCIIPTDHFFSFCCFPTFSRNK